MDLFYLLVDTVRANYISGFEFIIIISALCALNSENPIVCLGFFISLICSTAGFLISHGIYFIGYTYILIYVGAIAILFLFIIMLINIKTVVEDYAFQFSKQVFQIDVLDTLKNVKITNSSLVKHFSYKTLLSPLAWLDFLAFFIYGFISLIKATFGLVRYIGIKPNFSLILFLFIGIFGTLLFNLVSPDTIQFGFLNSLFNNSSIYYNISEQDISIYKFSDLIVMSELFYSDYGILFIIIGFMLILSIIGAISLVSL